MNHRYRSIFISDVHLGTKDVRNDYLLNFLKLVEAEYMPGRRYRRFLEIKKELALIYLDTFLSYVHQCLYGM